MFWFVTSSTCYDVIVQISLEASRITEDFFISFNCLIFFFFLTFSSCFSYFFSRHISFTFSYNTVV